MERIERKILQTFLYNNELKFSEIEKSIKIRSNKLAYHIKNLVKRGILEKSGETYKLSETAETMIPYLSEKNSSLPVILIALYKNSNQVYLYKRKKGPFKNKLSLPGGRITPREGIEQATKRIMKEKHRIDVGLEKVNSVSIEHVKKQGKENKLHSFFLIFVTAYLLENKNNKNKIEYTSLSKNKSRIIQSDYNLIKKDLNKETKINEFLTKD